MISVLSCLYLFPLLFLLSFPPLTVWPCVHAQLCLPLCNPMDYSPSGSSIHGTLQAGILSGLPCPPPGDLPEPGIEPVSPLAPVWQVDSLLAEPSVSPLSLLIFLPNPQTLLTTLMVPSWRIPLGRRKLFSLCSGDIRLHFVWVIYILEHTCVFHVEFKNPTEHLPSEPNWHLFPAFWRGFGAWG